MKKFLILAALVSLVGVASATTVKEARMNLGYELNQTVNILKEYFRTVKTQLEEDLSSVNEINAKVNVLSDKSKDKESNYTVLPQGKSLMPICKENEELRWDNSQWKCERPTYSSDCELAPGEEKIKIEGKGSVCKQDGNLIENNLGYGVCNDKTGERKTQIECLFKNAITGIAHQIANANCSPTKYTLYKQPCGPNGDKSSCKCPVGSSYRYKNGKAECVYTFDYVVDEGNVITESSSGDLSLELSTVCYYYDYVNRGGNHERHERRRRCLKTLEPICYISYSVDSQGHTKSRKICVKSEVTVKFPVNKYIINSYYYDFYGKKYQWKSNFRTTSSNYSFKCPGVKAWATWEIKTPIMKWSSPAGLSHLQATCIEGPEIRAINEFDKVTSDCWKKELVINPVGCKI